MPKPKPLVSVILAVRNGEPFLAAAINSILNQTFKNFELIILNDHSTDSTVSIVESYTDKRIRLIHNENRTTLGAIRNWGVELAQGRYIAIQDADDVSHPSRLEEQVHYLNTHLDVALVGSSFQKMDAQGRLLCTMHPPTDSTMIAWQLCFWGTALHHPTVMYRKKAIIQAGGFPANTHVAEDYALWLKILEHQSVANLSDVLVSCRFHPHSLTATQQHKTRKTACQLAKSHVIRFLPHPPDDTLHTAVFEQGQGSAPSWKTLFNALKHQYRLYKAFRRHHQPNHTLTQQITLDCLHRLFKMTLLHTGQKLVPGFTSIKQHLHNLLTRFYQSAPLTTSQHASTPQQQRFALINFGGIGDEILFQPVIQTIRHAYPDATLELILENRSLSASSLLPQIDKVIGLTVHHTPKTPYFIGIKRLLWKTRLFFRLVHCLQKGQYDAVLCSAPFKATSVAMALSGIPCRVGFDVGWPSRQLLTETAPLHTNIYDAAMYLPLASAFLNAVGHHGTLSNTHQPIPSVCVSATHTDYANRVLSTLSLNIPQHRIFIHPGVSQLSQERHYPKQWKHHSWAQLIESLLGQYPNSHIYLLGGPDDLGIVAPIEDACQSLTAIDKTRFHNLFGKSRTLEELAGFLSLADLVITVDSSPMHLAVALKRPVVSIFTCTDEHKYLPQASSCTAVKRDDLSCRPCLWVTRNQPCVDPICQDVPVSAVMKASAQYLASNS